MNPRPNEPGFCPLCGVSFGLHDGPGTCAAAEAKADVLATFYGMFR